MHNRHKLHLDSNRNTKNIKIIKIATENANFWGEILWYAHFAEICEKYGNMQNIWQSHIHIKFWRA